MSDFDKMKDEAEKLAQEHPDQVKQGEQWAEKEGKNLAEKAFGGQGNDQSGQDAGTGAGSDQSGDQGQ
jgi:hypothetical protein